MSLCNVNNYHTTKEMMKLLNEFKNNMNNVGIKILVVFLFGILSIDLYSQNINADSLNVLKNDIFQDKQINYIEITYYIPYKLDKRKILIYEDSLIYVSEKNDIKSNKKITNRVVILDKKTRDYLLEVVDFYFICNNNIIKKNLIEESFKKDKDYSVNHSDGPTLKIEISRYNWIIITSFFIELTKGNFIFEDKFQEFISLIDSNDW